MEPPLCAVSETRSDRLAAAYVGMFWLRPQCLRPGERQQGCRGRSEEGGVRLAQDLRSVVDGGFVWGDAD
jgi:hypothetical protein